VHQFGRVERELQGDEAADGVTGDMGRAHAQMAQQRGSVAGFAGHSQRCVATRAARPPATAVVYQPVPVRQFRLFEQRVGQAVNDHAQRYQ
jgi:hypothetical protein